MWIDLEKEGKYGSWGLCVFILLMAVLMVGRYAFADAGGSQKPLAGKVICIDAADAWDNSGGKPHDLADHEAQINWAVGMRLRSVLEQEYGAKVVMTKKTMSEIVPLKKRADYWNRQQADLVIRLSCDSESTGKKRGAAVYYPSKEGWTTEWISGPSEEVQILSELLAVKLSEALKPLSGDLPNLGAKTDAQTPEGEIQGALTASIYSKIPIATVAMCYWTNGEDLDYVGLSDNQRLMARQLAVGLADYLVGERKDADLRRIAAKFGLNKYAVYFEELRGGAHLGVNEHKTKTDPFHDGRVEGALYPASIMKLFLAFVVEDAISKGEIKPELLIEDSILNRKTEVKSLLRAMMVDSDNDAFNMLLRHLGVDWVNDRLAMHGIKVTRIYGEVVPSGSADYVKAAERNVSVYGYDRFGGNSTADEIGYVLGLIYNRKENEKAFSDLYALMQQCRTGENRIKAVVHNAKLAHKSGTSSTEGVYSDAGIIEKNGKAYIVVVLTEGTTEPKGEAFIRAVVGFLGED